MLSEDGGGGTITASSVRRRRSRRGTLMGGRAAAVARAGFAAGLRADFAAVARADFATGVRERADFASFRAFCVFPDIFALTVGRLAEPRRTVRFRAFLAVPRAFLAFRLAMSPSFPNL